MELELSQITLDEVAALIADKVAVKVAETMRKVEAGRTINVAPPADTKGKGTKPVETPKVEPAPEETPQTPEETPASDAQTPLVEDAQALLIRVVSEKGRETAIDLLAQAGGTRLGELDAEQKRLFAGLALKTLGA